ncbi:MAG: tRNA (guanosine(46)-N7)-methyltransferase TrmB [Bacteroidota bacterium]
MGKDKLAKFEENTTFPNVFQPAFLHEEQSVFPLKGLWNASFFKNEQAIILEIGCGKGEYTVELARINKDKNFIGIDKKGARLWRGAKTSNEMHMQNVAFLRVQIDWIEKCFSQNEVDEIWITFPDPQLKKSKARKRLTSPMFLKRYRHIMKPGGFIHLKTDNLVLFDYTLAIIKSERHRLIEKYNDIHSNPSLLNSPIRNIQTFYEKMFVDQGIAIHYLKFQL